MIVAHTLTACASQTIQYFSRFLAWYTYRTNHPQTTVAIFETTKKQFGSVRKAMRLGKFVEHFKAAAVASDNKSLDPILRYLAVGRQLGYAFYLLLDSIAYLDSSGIYKFANGPRLAQEAYRAWWAGLTCNILAGFYTLYNLQAATKKQADSGDAEKAVELKKLQRFDSHQRSILRALVADKVHSTSRATQLQLVSDLCDFVVPASALGYINLDDGLVGLSGTVSSLIGLTSAWNKAA